MCVSRGGRPGWGVISLHGSFRRDLNVVSDSTGSVSRFGLARAPGSVRTRFGSLFSSKVVVCGHCPVTLSLTINETLKWLSSLPILMQESFWW